MKTYMFVGERPSQLAEKIGASWERGGLSARSLHEALKAAGIEPGEQAYVNLFVHGQGRRVVEPEALSSIIRAQVAGVEIVAMGRRVQARLRQRGIPFLALVHPAARGTIRKRERYHAHVAEVLG